MILARLCIAVSIACALVAGPAWAGPQAARLEAASAQVDAVAREVMKGSGAPAGLAVVLAAEGETPVVLAYGYRNTATRAPVTARTPFYIASMTKAYVAALAVQLDREGVLDLDAPLVSAWPQLGGDLGQVRFRQWMSHAAPFENAALEFRTGYVGPAPEPLFSRLLLEQSRPRATSFEYSNTGYLIWRAAVEARTGRRLEDLMASRVFRPLGLKKTSMRTSDFKAGELAFAHVRNAEDGWTALPPKPDGLMHAAGGMMSSPQDVGRWLLVSLDPGRAGPLAAAVRETQSPQSAYSGDRRGLACDGYGLGWYRCAYGGERVLSHGGGYIGFGSLMTVAPDAGFGVAVLGNADTVGLTLTTELTKAALDAWAGRAPNVQATATLTAFLGSLAARQVEGVTRAREDPAFAGWTWSPQPDELRAYAGRYESTSLGEVVVATVAGGLRGKAGELVLGMQPAAPDVFGATSPASPRPEVVRFERAADGRVTTLIWGDWRFERR